MEYRGSRAAYRGAGLRFTVFTSIERAAPRPGGQKKRTIGLLVI